MMKITHEENRFHWLFTTFNLICMVSTFSLGWCLLKEFVSELLQSRNKDKLYSDIMYIGMIVLIFNISKFYLLLCFNKRIEIVDLGSLETDANLTEKHNQVKEAHEDGENKDDTEDQLKSMGQNTRALGLRREQSARENRANFNLDTEQNREQNFPLIQGCQNLNDGDNTNKQNNRQVQSQNSQDNESSVGRVLSKDDIQEHMHDLENQNIQPRQIGKGTKMNERCRSRSESEGQNYMSSRSQDDRSNKSHKLRRSIRIRRDPGPSSSQKNQSSSNIGKISSL